MIDLGKYKIGDFEWGSVCCLPKIYSDMPNQLEITKSFIELRNFHDRMGIDDKDIVEFLYQYAKVLGRYYHRVKISIYKVGSFYPIVVYASGGVKIRHILVKSVKPYKIKDVFSGITFNIYENPYNYLYKILQRGINVISDYNANYWAWTDEIDRISGRVGRGGKINKAIVKKNTVEFWRKELPDFKGKIKCEFDCFFAETVADFKVKVALQYDEDDFVNFFIALHCDKNRISIWIVSPKSIR